MFLTTEWQQPRFALESLNNVQKLDTAAVIILVFSGDDNLWQRWSAVGSPFPHLLKHLHDTLHYLYLYTPYITICTIKFNGILIRLLLTKFDYIFKTFKCRYPNLNIINKCYSIHKPVSHNIPHSNQLFKRVFDHIAK